MKKRDKWIILGVCIAVLVVLVIVISFVCTNTEYYGTLKELPYLQRAYITAKTLTLSSYTVISLAFSAVEVLVLYFLGKELNKEKHISSFLILFTLVCMWHTIEIITPAGDRPYIWLFVTTYSVLSTLLILQSAGKGKPSTEEKLVSYAKSRMNKWTGKVACFEVYSVNKRQIDNKTEYSINYLNGCWNTKTSLNAVLTSQLFIEHQDLEDFKPFFSIFHKNASGEETLPRDSILLILSPFSDANIKSIKEQLSSVERKDASASISDCCKCRLINIYLGCIDSIEKNHLHDYIGYECMSINTHGNWTHTSDQNEIEKLDHELNDRLFTDYRTGLLGAILLPMHSFIFSYEQKKHNYKADRKYVAFTLSDLYNHDSSLLVLITIEGTLENAIDTVNAIKAYCLRIGKD